MPNNFIDGSVPKDWQDLQRRVAQILQECGFETVVEKGIQTVRGVVNVDVYAEDSSQDPKTTYLCECKHWQSAVSKTIVHAFRTVVTDYGANWGFIISSGGFQSGAFEAAVKSNLRLLTWDEFQELFVDRWIEQWMAPLLQKEVDPLVEYTEPFNSRVFRKADRLNEKSQQSFIELREKYSDLAFLAIAFFVSGGKLRLKDKRPNLPLKGAIQNLQIPCTENLPAELLDANCLRDFADIICTHSREGIAAFDEVFGERA